MPRRGKPKHKTLLKNFLAVLTRPGALRPRPEQNLPFESLEGAIAAASSHISKFADDQADAEVFDITGNDRVKMWPTTSKRSRR